MRSRHRIRPFDGLAAHGGSELSTQGPWCRCQPIADAQTDLQSTQRYLSLVLSVDPPLPSSDVPYVDTQLPNAGSIAH